MWLLAISECYIIFSGMPIQAFWQHYIRLFLFFLFNYAVLYLGNKTLVRYMTFEYFFLIYGIYLMVSFGATNRFMIKYNHLLSTVYFAFDIVDKN